MTGLFWMQSAASVHFICLLEGINMESVITRALRDIQANRIELEQKVATEKNLLAQHRHGRMCLHFRWCRKLERTITEEEARLALYHTAEAGLASGNVGSAVTVLDLIHAKLYPPGWHIFLYGVRYMLSRLNFCARIEYLREDLRKLEKVHL